MLKIVELYTTTLIVVTLQSVKVLDHLNLAAFSESLYISQNEFTPMDQHRRFVAEIVNYLRRNLTPSSTATACAFPPGTCAKRWPTRSPTSGRPWAPWPRSTARRHAKRSYLLACRGWRSLSLLSVVIRRGGNGGAKNDKPACVVDTVGDTDWRGLKRASVGARAGASGGPLLTIVVVRIPSGGGSQSIVSSLHRLSHNIDNERSPTTVAFFFTPNERERDVRMIAHSAAAAIAVCRRSSPSFRPRDHRCNGYRLLWRACAACVCACVCVYTINEQVT